MSSRPVERTQHSLRGHGHRPERQLNGADNVSLLGGIINIPLFNGLLAPEQSLTVDINLTDLINALGLGNVGLSNLDLSNLLNQLGLGDLTLGSLFSDLGLSGDTAWATCWATRR